MAHEDTITVNKVTLWKTISGILALVVIVLLVNTFSNTTTGTTAEQAAAQPSAAANADMTVYSDDVVTGDANAPVTIIEYSDPSCPFCAAAAGGTEMVAYMASRSPGYEAAVPGIIKNYVDTGKARLVFRYFPGHGKGVEAMKILLCSNEQGLFWKLHDVFFNNQALMEAGDTAGLKKLAVDNGVDSAKLDACLDSKKYDSKLATDTQRGQDMGVQGTPGFFINGQEVSGAQPFSAVQPVIEAALKA